MTEGLLPMLVGVHLLSVLIVYLVIRKQGDCIQAATEAALVLLVPVAGLLLVIVTRLCQATFNLKISIDPHKLMHSNNVFTNMINYDENLISLHDTFLLDDVKIKRKVFLDAVKQNVLENPKILRQATHDSDREIAYYAVSMVSGHIEQLESRLAELEGRLREAPEDLQLVKEYAELLADYLQQDFIDSLTKREKGEVYVQQLDKLLAADSGNIEYLQAKINQEIQLESYQEAEATCSEFQSLYPDREEPYLDFMKLYATMREPEKLQQKLSELKASKAELSIEALKKVRYWGGAAHV